MTTDPHPALERILQSPGAPRASDLLADELSGTELTTFLLDIYQRRTQQLSLADVRRQFEHDRFVASAPVSGLDIARAELAALESASAAGFETLDLAPVTPLGLHHVLSATPQNNLVATSRGTEVAADPTNVLALEAAVRRTDLLAERQTRAQVVDLASTQRVTRAQHFEGPRSFAHFSIFGMTSAGRDQGDHRFELATVARQIAVLVATLRRVSRAPISVRLSPFNPELSDACEILAAEIDELGVVGHVWPEREHGRGYYRNLCFKVYLQLDDELVELGDGGDVDWMQELLQSRKERMVIGGLGLERLALVLRQTVREEE